MAKKKKGLSATRWVLTIGGGLIGLGLIRSVMAVLALKRWVAIREKIKELNKIPEEKWDESKELGELAKMLGTSKDIATIQAKMPLVMLTK